MEWGFPAIVVGRGQTKKLWTLGKVYTGEAYSVYGLFSMTVAQKGTKFEEAGKKYEEAWKKYEEAGRSFPDTRVIDVCGSAQKNEREKGRLLCCFARCCALVCQSVSSVAL